MNLKDIFPGHFKPTDEDYREIWDSCLFVLDTNTLVNLYRYSEPAKQDVIKILHKIQDRLWMPYQVAEEYLETRLNEISNQSKEYDNTEKEIRKLKQSLESSSKHPFISQETLESADLIFEKIVTEMKSNQEKHDSRFHVDDIQNQLLDIFSNNIGPQFEKSELEEIFEQGSKRYKEQIPPGFKDQGKNPNPESFKDKCRVYGDLIIWMEIIRKAKEKNVPIIFVTDDQKSDWWHRVNGKTISPRPELVKEFQTETSQKILLYVASSFIEHAADKFDEPVNEYVVNEIKDIQRKRQNSRVILNSKIHTNISSDNELKLKSEPLNEFDLKEILEDERVRLKHLMKGKLVLERSLSSFHDKNFTIDNSSDFHATLESIEELTNEIDFTSQRINLIEEIIDP